MQLNTAVASRPSICIARQASICIARQASICIAKESAMKEDRPSVSIELEDLAVSFGANG